MPILHCMATIHNAADRRQTDRQSDLSRPPLKLNTVKTVILTGNEVTRSGSMTTAVGIIIYAKPKLTVEAQKR